MLSLLLFSQLPHSSSSCNSPHQKLRKEKPPCSSPLLFWLPPLLFLRPLQSSSSGNSLHQKLRKEKPPCSSPLLFWLPPLLSPLPLRSSSSCNLTNYNMCHKTQKRRPKASFFFTHFSAHCLNLIVLTHSGWDADLLFFEMWIVCSIKKKIHTAFIIISESQKNFSSQGNSSGFIL